MTTDPTSQATHAVVATFFQALAQQNPVALAKLYAQQVDWYVPGEESLAPWLGRRHSREQVQAFFEVLFVNIEPVSSQLEHLLVEGNFAVATGEFASRMLSTGKVYVSLFSIQFTIQDKLIVRYRLQEDSLALVKALSS